ncbi:hypothetical protein [Aporhodopirellula aestuarii]|uniref:Uncharacterized protein n=1 Tax=Aporhodopirellula aestuarii TaxID=2950107 RepID=A0ABT0U157_9BACT|nr:hypothetical protein [Aporhodopirellula aestuarii]MCM2370223.1 hypothetical protein [Aporhodopirellula aestuarii]
MSNPSQVKKPLLYGLVGSVLFGATLGIIFVMRDTWGWLEVRVMLSTIVIAGASLCGLACDLSRQPLGRNLLPKAGLALTAISAALLLIGIWGDIGSDEFWRFTLCESIIAVATVHVCLLAIAKLAKRFRWVYFVSTQVIFGFALLLCSVILGNIDSAAVWRLIAAISIVVAALSLLIPILHRISKMDVQRDDLMSPTERRSLASINGEIARLQRRLVELEQVKMSLMKASGETPSLSPELPNPIAPTSPAETLHSERSCLK